jgi:hypothetical protein
VDRCEEGARFGAPGRPAHPAHGTPVRWPRGRGRREGWPDAPRAAKRPRIPAHEHEEVKAVDRRRALGRRHRPSATPRLDPLADRSSQLCTYSERRLVRTSRNIASVRRGPSGAGQAPQQAQDSRKPPIPRALTPRNRQPFEMVGETGFEPATPWSRTRKPTDAPISPPRTGSQAVDSTALAGEQESHRVTDSACELQAWTARADCGSRPSAPTRRTASGLRDLRGTSVLRRSSSSSRMPASSRPAR